ncbi:MAG TPA: hypothetical protein VM598_09470, partial [Bdellovibrionota bacterium]|nr:hypothetical protein [Bdellovibrionota bacterium]
SILSGANTITVFALNAGPLFNFSETIADSAFAFVAPGMLVQDSTTSSTNFQFVVGFGKRIPIVDHVSWMPMVAYTGITASTYLSGFSITPLQFSLLL